MGKKRLRKSPVEWKAFHNNPDWSAEKQEKPQQVNHSLVKIKNNKGEKKHE